jgi:nucleoside-diphosphate-sugar epimerase
MDQVISLQRNKSVNEQNDFSGFSAIKRSSIKNAGEKENNKVVLVAGGAGFVGSNLCRRLLAEGFWVYAVDNLSTGHRKNIRSLLSYERFNYSKLDISGRKFKKVFLNIPLTHIFHLACPTGVPNIALMGEEMLRTNSIGTFNIIDLVREHNAKLLFTSTAEVYGDPLETPQCEEYTGNVNPVGPRSPYEEGKRFAESLIVTASKKYNLNVRIVRIFNTYGGHMSLQDKRVIPQFISAIKENRDLCVYGDGNQKRTHLFVDDLINGLLIAMDKGVVREVYNIGGEHQATIKELAETVLKVAGATNKVKHEPNFIEDHYNRQPSTQKIQALGWKPVVSLEDGLARIMRLHGLCQVKPIAISTA